MRKVNPNLALCGVEIEGVDKTVGRGEKHLSVDFVGPCCAFVFGLSLDQQNLANLVGEKEA